MCLDEQEGDIIHDPANLQLWDCNGANNQTWSEKPLSLTQHRPPKTSSAPEQEDV
jgi:hypothetical protein